MIGREAGRGFVLMAVALSLARFRGEQAAPRRRVPDALKDSMARD